MSLLESLPEEILLRILALSTPLTIRRCRQVSLTILFKYGLTGDYTGLPIII